MCLSLESLLCCWGVFSFQHSNALILATMNIPPQAGTRDDYWLGCDTGIAFIYKDNMYDFLPDTCIYNQTGAEHLLLH